MGERPIGALSVEPMERRKQLRMVIVEQVVNLVDGWH
jgi:hypothetical protein